MTRSARLVHHAIDAAALLRAVAQPANGAILLFMGVVRDINEGRNVSGIEYSAYETMASKELQAILNEACERFGISDVVVEHRLGDLELEEASVGIAVAHPHRGAVYDASRWLIAELKRRVPIWKRERYTDGTREWVDPSGRPAGAASARR